MASVINNIKSNNIIYNIASTAYATCGTSASTAAKIAYIQGETSSGFTLATGTTVHVKFTHANEAASPTLTINSTGAKPINCSWFCSKGSSTYNHYNYWEAGEVVTLTYDGTYWQINKSMPNFSSLNARLVALDQQLQELGSAEGNVLHIDMHGSGTVVTHSNVADDVKNYSIRLYSDGASMGHAYWDNGTPSNQTPAGSGTYTLSQVFNYMHSRILIALPAADLTTIVNKNITGLDLYFSNTSVDASGYTATVVLEETVAVAQPVTGDTSFVVFNVGTVEAETNGDSSSSGSIMHIDFTDAYTYSGSNLSILIKFDSSGYNSSHAVYGQINLYYE